MVSSWLWVILIVPAFFVLNEGAKLVTDTAAAIARRSGRSKFVIGVLLVSALGALPEVLVAVLALMGGHTDLAIGNVLGSSILNMSILIGLPALFTPILVKREILARDIFFLASITLVVAALLVDGRLTFTDGAVLLLLFIPYAANLLSVGRMRTPQEIEMLADESEIELELIGQVFRRRVTVRAGVHWLLIGLVLLAVGANVVTKGAVSLLDLFDISPFIVGITVLSLGTSLPDAAAAIQAVRRGHPDMALAIGIGASIFTLLLTLGIMGLGFQQTFSVEGLVNTLIVMCAQILFVLLFATTGRSIGRAEGAILFAFYPIYVTVEIMLRGGLS